MSLSRIFVPGFFCKLLSKHVWRSLVPCLKFHAFRTIFWTLKTNASEVWDLLFFEMHLILNIQKTLKLQKFLVVSRSDVHIDFGVKIKLHARKIKLVEANCPALLWAIASHWFDIFYLLTTFFCTLYFFASFISGKFYPFLFFLSLLTGIFPFL